MYKNLSRVLAEMGIKKSSLSKDVLFYEYPKYLSIRLNNSTKFSEEEMDRIYSFLKDKGYEGEKDFLFEYSEYIPSKKERQHNRISAIINRKMKEFDLTNGELADLIHVSENTISLWRNGKIKNIDSGSIIPLSETLNINPLNLLFDNRTEVTEFISDEYHQNKIDYKNLIEFIYNQILQYQKSRGYEQSEINISSITEELIKEEISKTINSVNSWIDAECGLLLSEELVEYKNADAIAHHYFSKNEEMWKEINLLRQDLDNPKKKDRTETLKKINRLSRKIYNNTKLADKLYRNELGLSDTDANEEDDDFIWKD